MAAATSTTGDWSLTVKAGLQETCMDITALLEEIKASPYRDITIAAPHTGKISFADLALRAPVQGPQGAWKEKPGTRLAVLERERNPKSIHAMEKGRITRLHTELEGCFVEAGQPLAVIRHMLTRDEVETIILKKALHLFRAPERAKYYFTPEIDKKIRASDAQSVTIQDGAEIMIMSRMKREAPLKYAGPPGVIYAIYFKYNENKDAGDPLIGVCPKEQLSEIQDVIMRVRTEWREQE